MTNRIKGFLVTLEKNLREDDVEGIITAINMIRGVGSIKPYIATAEDYISYHQAYNDCMLKVFKSLKDISSDKIN